LRNPAPVDKCFIMAYPIIMCNVFTIQGGAGIRPSTVCV